MIFSSYGFIFIFLPIVWLGFHLLKHYGIKADSPRAFTLAKAFLVLSSLFFYAYWKLIYLPILLGSIAINYLLAKLILSCQVARTDICQIHTKNGGGGELSLKQTYTLSAKTLLIIGIIFNLCLLGIFKYTDFFLENFNLFTKLLALDFTIPLPHILLPLALSFVTFQQIAFLVDCYRQATDRAESNNPTQEIPDINFLDYCLFITFFPQLIAGPIVHHREMMPQFHAMNRRDSASGEQGNKTCGLSTQHGDAIKDLSCKAESTKKAESLHIINWEYIAKGLFIFSIGLFKKVVIADSFAKWANAGSTTIESGAVLNLLESWACALSHMFEYYFDFSGYCDMAIGLGLLFGIVLPVNFNSPFKSLSIAEFWRRWHMTLGRFLKHYVYIPLGGSRVPLIFNLRNLFIVFLVSGIWHGAGFGFIIWGCIHGISVCIHKLYTIFYKKLSPQSLYTRFMRTKLYIVLCWGLTFFIVLVARVFYISPNLESAFRLLKGMFFGSLVLPKSLESKLGEVVNLSFGLWLEGIKGDFTIVVWILGAFALCLVCRNSVEITDSLAKRANAKMLLAGWLFAYALIVIAGSSYTPQFLYFNF